MKKNYKDMTVGEGLITALEQAVDYEKGKKVIGITSRKMSIAPLPDYKAPASLLRGRLFFVSVI